MDIVLHIRRGDGDGDDDGGDELEVLGRDVQPQRQRDDQAVDDAAEHDADDALADPAAAAGKDLADDQTRQRDRDHAGAEVDVAELVVLTDQAAGERREGVGEAQADRDGDLGVDGGGADHVETVARRADGKSERRAEKPDEHDRDHTQQQREQHQRAPLAAAGECLEQRKDRIAPRDGHVGRKAHDREVDRIQAGVRDDAGEDALHAEARLQKGGDEAREHTSSHGRRQRQKRMPRDGEHRAHGAAERKAAVGREVCNVQDGKADEQRQRDEAVNQADLKRGLQHCQHKRPSFGISDISQNSAAWSSRARSCTCRQTPA